MTEKVLHVDSVRGRVRPLPLAFGVPAIVLGLSGYLACSHEAPPKGSTPPVAPDAGTDPAKLFPEIPVAPQPKYTLPELAFEDHSEGLPTSGTWVGYPLLYDFTGDKHADLVTSNREEDGYNAWESQVKGPWIRR